MPAAPVRVALLLEGTTFESYYRSEIGIDRATYLARYRNDWSLEHAAALVRAGGEVWVYAPTLEEPGVFSTPFGWRVRLVPASRAWRPLEAVRPYLRTAPGRYAKAWVDARLLWPNLRAALHDDAIDVVYMQGYGGARFDVLTRRIRRPVIAVDQANPPQGRLLRARARRLRRAAGLVVQTRGEQRRLAAGGVASELLPNFVDTDFFAPADRVSETHPSGKRLLLAAVLNDWKKRPSDVIRALAILPAEWTLVIAGSGPDERMLRGLVGELDLVDRVTFTGFVLDREELREHYRACDVFALPSTHEGLPLAVLEAMACGKPVVVSTFPAYDDLVQDGDNGMRVPLARPDLLAGAVLRAADDPAMGRRARRTVEMRHGGEAARTLAELVLGAAGDPPASG